MKKILVLVLCLALALGMLTACGGGEKPANNNNGGDSGSGHSRHGGPRGEGGQPPVPRAPADDQRGIGRILPSGRGGEGGTPWKAGKLRPWYSASGTTSAPAPPCPFPSGWKL